ncbi:MAG TPA: segregation/condensation protein A [Saprospiraceae bacterium]|nr:segregation/condensation protein A [Saprospiraceae bacterium]HMQ83307.1 segregation/condensation protein A [Saprospiraceae bacterium]
MDQAFTIKLPQFEGPFDLLLFFIERDELDIYDIPIGKITDDFLNYIRQMEQLNIDLASEFILVAATLCRIKAKMLLPRKAIDDEGNEIDPREELVSRLLEYKRYKSILEEMREMEERRSKQNVRGNVSRELAEIATKALVDSELESLNLFKLLRVFERAIQRFETAPPKTIHRIVQFSYTIEDSQDQIMEKVALGKRVDFVHLIQGCQNRIHAIVVFLALLELLNRQLVRILPGLGANNFWLEERILGEEEE